MARDRPSIRANKQLHAEIKCNEDLTRLSFDLVGSSDVTVPVAVRAYHCQRARIVLQAICVGWSGSLPTSAVALGLGCSLAAVAKGGCALNKRLI